MLNKLKKLIVAVVGSTFLITAVAPVSAAPVLPSASIAEGGNVQNVDDRRWRGNHRRYNDRRYYGPRPGWDRPRGPRPDWNGRHYRGPRAGYWNGHRGYRDYRPGYRRYNDGWWYPLAAFGAAAIIGGALATPAPAAPVYRYSNAHVQWCYNRYRSYRASDNTFQPNNGPRKQCRSPYS